MFDGTDVNSDVSRIKNDHDVEFRVGDTVAAFAGRGTSRWELCEVISHQDGYIDVHKYKLAPDGQLTKLQAVSNRTQHL